MEWARYATEGCGYEVSSKGDKRFSAFYARLKDGRTIEEAYQLDVKGYREVTNDPMVAKGKKPLRSISPEEQWQQYKALWREWADAHPFQMMDLIERAEGKVLTDMFATSEINQARALAEIISEDEGEGR